MIEFIFAFPILCAPLLYRLRSRILNRSALVGYSASLLVFAAGSVAGKAVPLNFLPQLSTYFKRDPLGDLYFVITALVFAAVALYSVSFLRRRKDDRWDTIYTILMLVFAASMCGALFSAHYGLFWVFIEATTLSSAVLIYFERTKESLAAVWKYIFICSIGIAFAFVGIILLTIGSKGNESLFFADMASSASAYSPFWLKMAFVFLLAGFGTKVGLAPLHSWKPDAYAAAPSAVSAILAGALSNCAFLGILRVLPLMNNAGLAYETKGLLMIMGVLSVGVAALSMLRIDSMKRIFAYSSIEQMGLVAIGIAAGGVYGALLLSISHSLIKSALFMTAGNIEHRFASHRFADISSITEKDRISSILLFAGAAGITAFPPFSSFISEFTIFVGVFKSGYYLYGALTLFLLAVIMYAFISHFGSMLLPPKSSAAQAETDKSPAWELTAVIPQSVLLAIALWLGISIPGTIHAMIAGAEKTIGM
jgi:hydrogenase-4 component F